MRSARKPSMSRLNATLALLGASLLALPAQAGLLLDLSSAGSEQSCLFCGSTGTTYGYRLALSQALAIDALGAWDQGSDGLGADTRVGLFDASGTLLASVSIDGTASAQASSLSSGQWLMASISPLLLGPGEYLLGQVFFDGLPIAQVDPGFSSSPLLSVLGGVSSPDFDTGLSAPSLDFPALVAGPTLSGRAVPEPASLALVLGALLALSLSARRRPGAGA